MDRRTIAFDLVRNAVPGSVRDHLRIANRILDGVPLAFIATMPEATRWPKTRAWLRLLADSSAIGELA